MHILGVLILFRYDRMNELVHDTGVKKAHICRKLGKSQYYLRDAEKINTDITGDDLKIIADALMTTPAYLSGESDQKTPDKLKAPGITEDYVTFPVLGEVAAGFDRMGFEDWTGDTVEVPVSYLKGRKAEDFFVLRVFGESMYPMYQHGDYVLVLRQDHLTHSGEVGVVLYDDEKATIKRVEYTEGKVKLVPVNPNVPPVSIEGEALEHYRVLGVPKWVIREIGD